MTDLQPSKTEPREVRVVRIRLGAERPAPQPDPLGRATIGYVAGLSPAELWRRGRGVWKAKLATVADSELALLVVDDIVRLVGTVDGVTFHDDRVAIEGSPLPDHPLIGQRDPLLNTSRNPITYGTVRTVVVSSPPRRERAQLFADAVSAMTEAARLRRRVLQSVEDAPGKVRWEPHPTQTEPADWAEFVTDVIAASAANVGGIEAALVGRPGSWEADHVRNMLTSTVGSEDELWRYRTEPMRIILDPDLYWLESLYAKSSDAIGAMAGVATAEFDTSLHRWTYHRSNPEWTRDVGFTGDFICDDPAAPPWAAVEERYKDDMRADGIDDAFISMMPSPVTTIEARVSKTDQDREEMKRLNDLADQVAAPYEALQDALEEKRMSEIAQYVDRLRATLLDEATRLHPGLPVEVHVLGEDEAWPEDFVPGDDHTFESPEEHLIRHALENTPLPNSGLLLRDYTPQQRYALDKAEEEAGRLPHLRLAGMPR